MEYLRWNEVQERLTSHARITGQPYSFYDAMRELWEEGACHVSEELPEIPGDRWDVSSVDELIQVMGEIPVRMDHFTDGFRRGNSAIEYSVYKRDRAIRPVRTAWDQAVGLHRHMAMEIQITLKGGAELWLGSGAKKLPENSVCLVAPGVEHDVLTGRGSLVINFSLSQQVIEDTLYRMLENESVLSRFFRDSMSSDQASYLLIEDVHQKNTMPFLLGILREHYREREYSDVVKEAYLTLLLTQLLRYSGNFERFDAQEDRRGVAPVLAILKYIQTHYRTTSLQETATYFHYEAGYLGKLIKRATGKNYTTIVGELRIDEAKRLITDTDLSIEDIGERTGFESSVHFSRTFKAAMGMAPSLYRKLNRN